MLACSYEEVATVSAKDAREIKVCLRAKNQLTLPEAIAERLDVGPGDILLLSVDETDQNTIRVRPLRKSYAGVATGVYGGPEEIKEYLQNERASWDT
jgi:bifunctional DNA-binding transcriptional regulator/antitoxin component of YhaV-PrlF toxin-antitoxin module